MNELRGKISNGFVPYNMLAENKEDQEREINALITNRIVLEFDGRKNEIIELFWDEISRNKTSKDTQLQKNENEPNNEYVQQMKSKIRNFLEKIKIKLE